MLLKAYVVQQKKENSIPKTNRWKIILISILNQKFLQTIWFESKDIFKFEFFAWKFPRKILLKDIYDEHTITFMTQTENKDLDLQK